MKVGVLGTGMVGRAIATKLAAIGHDVTMGSRSPGNESALAWARDAGGEAGTFADAAASAEVVFNCTAGAHSLAALEAAGEEAIADKLLIDVANPLDFSQPSGPALAVAGTDSLGEQIQRALPRARVVKALNTVNAEVMVDPDRIEGDHVVFVCGDDSAAKERAVRLVGELGWPEERVVDLGPIAAARASEMYLPLWIALMGRLGTSQFNIELRRAAG